MVDVLVHRGEILSTGCCKDLERHLKGHCVGKKQFVYFISMY